MSTLKTVDIIVPCFNPRNGWELVLSESISKVKNELPENALNAVILVNDGSTQGFLEQQLEQLLILNPEIKVIQYGKNQGKGYAVRVGIKSSEADLQMYTDVDFPYEDASVVAFYNQLAENEADVIVASRGDSYYDSLSNFRRILSKSLRLLNGILFGLKIKDTQGGLKGFNAAGREVFLQTNVNRYLFDLEFIQKASKTELRMIAKDVMLKPDVVLPSPSLMVLLKELNNFVRLLFSR